MGEFGSLGIFLLVALLFPVMALGPAFLLQPKQPSPQKYIPYECGVDPIGSPYVQFRAGDFLYALLFIVFDNRSPIPHQHKGLKIFRPQVISISLQSHG